MNFIAATEGRPSTRRAGLATLTAIAALLLAVLLPAAADAEDLSASPLGPVMSLGFASHDARLVGGSALVRVRCKGPVGGTCVGTVSVVLGGNSRKVPFSVQGGRSQTLAVPIGRRGRLARRHVRVIARTMQPLGACSETERFLRVS